MLSEIRLVRVAPPLAAVAGGFLLILLVQHSFLPATRQQTGRPSESGSRHNEAALTGSAPSSRVGLNAAFGKLPLAFEENQGQTDPTVKFLYRARNGSRLFLTSNEAVLVFGSGGTDRRIGRPQSRLKTESPQAEDSGNPSAVRMRFLNANPHPSIAGLKPLPGKSNYFMGNDSSRWKINVPQYASVKYGELYPGIDLIYYGNEGQQLEYDLIVSPGADPEKISLRFEEAVQAGDSAGMKPVSALRIDGGGNLVLGGAWGEMRQHAPRVYQEFNGARKEVSGRYILRNHSTVGFAVSNYDRTRPLVLDPSLAYASYLGGSDDDAGTAIAADASGNAYLTGVTSSVNFPIAGSALQRTKGVAQDAFVSKFNPQGSALIYSTFLGGNGTDKANAIAVDASGNVYLTGITFSSNFPTVNAFQTTSRGNPQAFVSKLNASGSALLFSTYLGGARTSNSNTGDRGLGIAVDPSGNTYVSGSTDSPTFPTRGALQATFGGGQNDLFVAKFDPTGGLVYSTYLGGSGKDTDIYDIVLSSAPGGSPITVDASGNIYVVGATNSPNFRTTPNAFQPAFIPSPFQGILLTHAFVSKINPSGSTLVYSTFLQGTGQDSAYAIAVDRSGNAYITGGTFSTDFPVVNGLIEKAPGGSDAYLAKLDASGSTLLYSTFLGGAAGDYGRSIALDSSGNIYVAGDTGSTDLPLTSPVQSILGGGLKNTTSNFPPAGDAFVMKLNPSGSRLLFSTYLGGSDFDIIGGIAVDPSGNIYIGGATKSPDFPVFKPLQATFAGGGFPGPNAGGDAFIARIDASAATPGEFLRPIADATWTGTIRVDTNQNGVPDPDDDVVSVERIQSGSSISLRFISPLFGTADLALSNPDAQGRFQTAVRRKPSAGGRKTRTMTVVLDQFDANRRLRSASLTYEIATSTATTRETGRVTAVDENGDGVIDYFSGGPTDQPAVRVSLVYVDVNGDGKPDFATIPWGMSSLLGAANDDPQIFVPLGDTDGDGIADSPAFDFDNNGKPDPELLLAPRVAGPGTVAEQKLYFAQFGDGAVPGAQIVSQISLFNPDTVRSASARIAITDDAGNPVTVELNGELISGQKDVSVPPGGLRILRTPGTGPLTAGSVKITSDKILAGVIVFGGTIGFTGVGSSPLQFGGFIAPIETNSAAGTSTGIAIIGLDPTDLPVVLELRNPEGLQVATASLDGANSLKPGSHLARFVQEFNWSPSVDFSSFSGTLKASFPGTAAATVLKTQPGQLTTLPVAPILAPQPYHLGLQKLYFAQFGDGALPGGKIVSEISLFNLDASNLAHVTLVILDDLGRPVNVALNGENVAGKKTLTVPQSGLRVLKTPGLGPVTVGSVRVTSDRPLGGVIVFGGTIGFTGVGSSASQSGAFLAPVEANASLGASTGIAMTSLETGDITADLQLLNSDGRQVATSRIDGGATLKAGGHLARFVNEFNWTPPVDFSNFVGVMKVTASGRIAATVLKSQPNQLTTVPVAPRTN